MIPDFNVDIGRRRGGQNEFVAFDADSAGVADKSCSVLRVPESQVMRSVARRIENFKIAFADGDGFSAFERPQIVFRNRKYGSVEAIHFRAVKAAGACEQFCRIGHVDRAKFVNEDGEFWIFLDESADGAGVIEMNVREQNRVEILNAYAAAIHFSAKRFERGGRPGIDERVDSVGLHERGGDGFRAAHPVHVNRDVGRQRRRGHEKSLSQFSRA